MRWNKKIDAKSCKSGTIGVLIVLFLFCLSATGQVLRGMATNGTTKKPAAGDDVVLLKLDKGMDEEARTKTNAKGEFSFELPDSQTMRAVRVRHQNVNYFQPVFPGSASVAVTVYEAAPAVEGIHRTDESMVFQAQGNTLQGFQVFNVKNDSQPPRTQPTFTFYLPDGATILSGEALRSGGMPLKSAPSPLEEKNKYQFNYPVVPGQTHFEVIFRLPYTGTLSLEPKFAGAVEKFYVITPKSMGFAPQTAAGYQTSEQWPVAPEIKGITVHAASDTRDEKQLAFAVAGEGVLPQQDEPGQQSSATGQDEGRPGGGLGVPNERPNPLSSGQWKFLGVLTLFMAAGAVIVFVTSRNQNNLAPAAPQGTSAPVMDALKEEMFQLEAERLQGKISGHEYDAAKAALVKTLQRAMSRKQ